MAKSIRSIALPDALIMIPAPTTGGWMTLYRLNNPRFPAPANPIDPAMAGIARYLELSITPTHTLLSPVS